MKKKICNVFLSIITMILPAMVVKAVNYTNATFAIDPGQLDRLSDDKIVINGLNSAFTGEDSILATVTNAAVNDSSCKIKSVLTSGGAVTIKTEDGKDVIQVDSGVLEGLLKANSKLYINIYELGDGGSYCLATGAKDKEVTVPYSISVKDVTVSVDRKGTVTLSDDRVVIKGVDGNVTGIKVLLSKTNNAASTLASGTSTTTMTASGSDYIIPSSYYAGIAEGSEKIYLSFYGKDNKLLRGNILLDGSTGLEEFENFAVNLTGNTSSDQSSTNIKIVGVTLSKPEEYFAVYTTSNDTAELGSVKTIPVLTGSSCANPLPLTAVGSGNSLYYTTKGNECFLSIAELKNGGFLTIYKLVDSTCQTEGGNTTCTSSSNDYKKVTESVKINRPADLELGKRITVNLTATSSLLYMNNLASHAQGAVLVKPVLRKANYKIGIIDNKTILRNIRDKRSGAYSSLLQYAKDAKAVTSGKVDIYPNAKSAKEATEVAGAIYQQKDVSEGSYYFLYLELEDSDGRLYTLEEVQLLGAKKDSSGKIELVNQDNINLDEEEEISGDGESSSNGTTKKKNPKTGFISYTIIAITVSVIAIVIYIKTKKTTKFPQS